MQLQLHQGASSSLHLFEAVLLSKKGGNFTGSHLQQQATPPAGLETPWQRRAHANQFARVTEFYDPLRKLAPAIQLLDGGGHGSERGNC
eukprot:207-Heterococcus_DN1.PRE.1